MAKDKALSATPYVQHVPDDYTDTEKAEGASWPLGAGYYDVGFEINGAKFPLARLHAGEVQKQFDLAKAKRKEGDEAPAETDTEE